MNKSEYAQNFLKQGFSCSQSVLSAFVEQFGLDRDIALRISSAFGGGMGGRGEVCGAVTAAFMVIGLKYGSAIQHDDKERDLIGSKAGMFMNKFKSSKGSILCRDLLGADVGTSEGLNKAKTEDLFETICPDVIRCSVEIIEELISDDGTKENRNAQI
jgi:C_GCAxxG_C_C family probable redox protein